MMKIIITCDPDIDNKEEVIFGRLKRWCFENVRDYEIEIEGTDYKYSVPEEKGK